MTKLKKINTLVLIVFMTLITLTINFTYLKLTINSSEYNRSVGAAPEHAFTEIENPFSESNYISYTEFRDTIATVNATASYIKENTKDKNIIIRIDTAEELHRFSVDVSPFNDINYHLNGDYARMAALLELDYVLGNDIDYLEVTGNRFIPIGFDYISDEGFFKLSFKGSFNGRGFEIRNLYLADYSELVIMTDEEDIATTPYYAMFAFNEGEIKNFGLIDPRYELSLPHEDISKVAHIVGENTGLVEKTYVIYNAADTGIRFKTITGQTEINYEAAGIVYYNKDEGTVNDSYFTGTTVIHRLHVVNFAVQPVIYKSDNANVSDMVYDSTRYLHGNINVLNIGKTDEIIKTNGLGTGWFYYPNNRYPALFGLNKQGTSYAIHNSVEFIYFNKLLRLNYSDASSINYRNADYVIEENIDLRSVSKSAYVTPIRPFDGRIDGNNKTLGYFELNKGMIVNEEYYVGLFSVFTGELYDLNIVKANMSITLDEAPNMNYHIGIVSGTFQQAEVKGISIEGTIDLKNKRPGTLAVGMLVGDASGTIEDVYINGDLTANTISASSTHSTIQYFIGGVVGQTRTNQLNMDNVLHIGDITGPTSQQQITNTINISLGGVIGSIVNTTVKHNFYLITHVGKINLPNILANTLFYVVGGVVGNSGGTAFNTSNINRDWLHRGTIFNEITNVNTTTKKVYVSGVLNADHSEATEFLGLYNDDLLINESQVGFVDYQNNRELIYTGLIHSRNTHSLTVSQSLNSADLVYNYFYTYSGIVKSNGYSLLRFVENTGNATYENFNYTQAFTIAGITQDENTDYLNVTHSGNIILRNLTNNSTSSTSNNISVAGITNTLTSQRSLKNSYKMGNIVVANINLNMSNLYVAGLVNFNHSGDLDTQGDTNPKATQGIINSINYGNITSTDSSTVHGINGRGNTLVGGIATANGGSIQDSINHGNITLYNKFTTPTVSFSSNDSYAGRVTSYQSGIVLGGIVASISNNKSRVYDTSNGGDIVGVSQKFVRTGGIVGIALYPELSAGNASALGNNTISDSIISNGINYGSVVAITNEIGSYGNGSLTARTGSSRLLYYGNTNSVTYINLPTLESTEDRPMVYASSGGVIGYGLAEMKRMINHGKIISTDVAGGVVGATFVSAADSNGTTTYVKIDTAINYGSVRAFKKDNYGNVDVKQFSLSTINNYLYGVNDDFIYPTAISKDEMRRYPRHKRGIGGVFGRLQRGVSQYMYGDGTNGSQFDFIVNMDPNVDLIGRVDQVHSYSSSLRYFVFGNDTKYYSAKKDDTTQVAFTGFYFIAGSQRVTTNSYLEVITYNKTRYYEYNDGTSRYRVYQGYGTSITYRDQNNNRLYEKKMYFTEGNNRYYDRESRRDYGGAITASDNTQTWRDLGVRLRVGEANPDLAIAYFPSVNGKNVPTETYAYSATATSNTPATSGLAFYKAKEVPWITEDPLLNEEAINIYDEAFEMRNEKTLLSNNEPITSYIYYADNDVLGERFSETRQSGMYVLATTSGSVFGSTLPINTQLSAIARLDGKQSFDIDYESLDNRETIDINEDYRYLKYKNLFQVELNDKSKLLQENQNLKMYDDERGLTLVNPTIDHVSQQVTFDFNMALLGQNQTSIDFDIISALLPYKAFIAEPYHSSIHPDKTTFREALRLEFLNAPSKVASNIHPPKIGINFEEYPTYFQIQDGKYNLLSATQTLPVGTFRSYSEAALTSNTLMDNYYSDYTVNIRFIRASTTGTIRPISYRVGTGSTTAISSNANIDTFTIPTSVASILTVNHRDTSGILNIGHDIKEFIKLYYQDTTIEVEEAYYTVTTTPVDSSGNFQMIITLDERLRGGSYLIEYKYFASDAYKYFSITKAQNTSANILDFKHEYISALLNPSQSFSTMVPLLYDISTEDTVIKSSTIEGVPPYLNNTTYSIDFLETLTLSSFAKLNAVSITKTYLSTGYVRYVLTYQIMSESGATKTYTHTINEEAVSLSARYINGVVTYNETLVSSRDAEMTSFEFEYTIESLYQTIFYNLNASANVYLEIISPDYNPINYQIIDNRLTIHMDNQVLPGNYSFVIRLRRLNTQETYSTLNLGTQTITKEMGNSSYLTNVAFGDEGTELGYPTIHIINETSVDPIEYNTQNINPKFRDYKNTYSPFVYYVGIEYDGADINNTEKHIRIIGEVDNVNLNEFVPRMVEYLPIGATIQRLYYEDNVLKYTVPITKEANSTEIASLEADYTTYPRDGSEPSDSSVEDVIITYKVTSEDGSSTTYYYISVVDATYNITYVFNIYYVINGIRYSIEDITTFDTQPIRIQIGIMDTGLSFVEVRPTVAQFPSFNSIAKYESHMSVYYQSLGSSNANYRHRFARNKAGFYQFIVDLPTKYEYTMFYNNQELNDVSSHVLGVEGKYFYINQGIRNRTRIIDVIIKDAADQSGWGLNRQSGSYLFE